MIKHSEVWMIAPARLEILGNRHFEFQRKSEIYIFRSSLEQPLEVKKNNVQRPKMDIGHMNTNDLNGKKMKIPSSQIR